MPLYGLVYFLIRPLAHLMVCPASRFFVPVLFFNSFTLRPVPLGLFADDDSSQSQNVRLCHRLGHACFMSSIIVLSCMSPLQS